MATASIPGDFLPRPRQAEAARYSGLARAIIDNPGWLPQVNPWESIIAQNRAREAAAARLAAQARAMEQQALRPPGPFAGPSLPSLAGQPGGTPYAPVQGEVGPKFGPFLGAPQPRFGLTQGEQAAADRYSAQAPQPGTLPEGAGQPGSVPYSLEARGEALGLNPATGGTRMEVPGTGPAPSIPVRQNGVLVGETNADGMSTTPQGLPLPELTEDQRIAAERAAGGTGFDYAYSLQRTQDDFYRTMGSKIGSVQEQAYGKPVDYVDGQPVFDASYQKYIGIDKMYQAQGLLPQPRIPTPPGPDATEEQKARYRDRLERALRAPQYQVGEDWRVWQGKTVAETREIQRLMRAAGGYGETEFISWGIPGESEYKIMNDWMARANFKGVDWRRIAEEDIANRLRIKRESGRGGGGGGGGGDTNTQISIQYTQTSMAAGRSMLERVLADAIGRAPSNSELRQFMAMLNAAENKSPTRTVTNYVRGDGTMTSTSRTNPSDVDPEAMAEKFAQQINGGSEFGDYQTNQYIDGLLNMLIGAQNV